MHPHLNPIPFAEFREKVLALYLPPLRARSTFLGMRHALDLVAAPPGPETTADLTTDLFARFIAAREGRNVNTTISILRYLRTACSIAVEEGWLGRNPFRTRRLKLRRVPPRGLTHLAIEQVRRLLEYLEALATDWRGMRLFALAATIAYTGLRRDEALFLQLGDVRPAEGLLAVVARRRLKTDDSAALVPVPDELAAVLARWLPEAGPTWLFPGATRKGPWTGGMPGYKPLDRLKAAGRAAGIEGLTFHLLRHSLATHLAGTWGLSAEQVRQVLRHTSARTTIEHYIHRDAATLRAAVRGFSYRQAS